MVQAKEHKVQVTGCRFCGGAGGGEAGAHFCDLMNRIYLQFLADPLKK